MAACYCYQFKRIYLHLFNTRFYESKNYLLTQQCFSFIEPINRQILLFKYAKHALLLLISYSMYDINVRACCSLLWL
ncbi:MAG: hypothetical protein JWQ57_1630 [Mucilaginibacter sp.]|nr:hypothetical protein [Mucilaginibacter sp.]